MNLVRPSGSVSLLVLLSLFDGSFTSLSPLLAAFRFLLRFGSSVAIASKTLMQMDRSVWVMPRWASWGTSSSVDGLDASFADSLSDIFLGDMLSTSDLDYCEFPFETDSMAAVASSSVALE